MDEKHKIAKERFEEAISAVSYQREMIREALAFSNPADPQQWSAEAARARKLAKRPLFVYDRTNQYINNTVNQYRQSKLSIETMPVDDKSDSHTSQVIDGILRHVEHRCRAWIARETAVDHMVRAGIGYTVVVPELVGDQTELAIKRVIDPCSVVFDPDCQEPDGLGAEFAFWCESVGEKKFKAKYGDKTSPASWNIDNANVWRDQDTIVIANYFELIERKETILRFEIDGRELVFTEPQYLELAQSLGYPPGPVQVDSRMVKRVKWSKMTGYETLEETEIMSGHIPVVPYVGDELLVDGRLYRSGLTKKMMASQISYNMTRNLEVEFMAKQPKAPMMVAAAAVGNYAEEWANLNTGAPAYLLYDHVDEQGNPIPTPSQLNPAPLPTGFQYLGNKELADMEASAGIFQPNLGKPGAVMSGRAKLADKAEGDTNTFHYQDNAARSLLQEGRILVDMLPHYYRERKIARILGADGKPESVQLRPGSGQTVRDGKKVLSIDLEASKYDVRIKEGAKSSTQREEAVFALQEVLKSNAILAPALVSPLLKLMDIPDAEKYAAMALAMSPPEVQKVAAEFEDDAPQVPPEAQAEIMQLSQQVQEAQSIIQEAQAAVEEAKAEAEAAKQALNEMRATKQIEAARLELDGMKLDFEIEKAALEHETRQAESEKIDAKTSEEAKTAEDASNVAIAEATEIILESNDQVLQAVQQIALQKPVSKTIAMENDENGLPVAAVVTETLASGETTTKRIQFSQDSNGLPTMASI